MAQLFHLTPAKRLRAVWLPACLPYLLSACRVSVGMALKAGVAGEIIGLPRWSIGEQLYCIQALSKYGGFVCVVAGDHPAQPGAGAAAGFRACHCAKEMGDRRMMLRMEHIDKAFDGNAVLHDLCWTLGPGECWQVTGASGIGNNASAADDGAGATR